jgi:hypothetical protein
VHPETITGLVSRDEAQGFTDQPGSIESFPAWLTTKLHERFVLSVHQPALKNV